MKKAIQYLVALVALTLPLIADAPAWTWFSQAKIDQAEIGAQGQLVVVGSTNYGGTGLSAGKITALDGSGAVLWQHSDAFTVYAHRVAAAQDAQTLAAVSHEQTGLLQNRLILRVWKSPSAGSTPWNSYDMGHEYPSASIVPWNDPYRTGVHVNASGRWVVAWVHNWYTNQLRVLVVDARTGVAIQRSYANVMNGGIFPMDASSLSDDGSRFHLRGPGYDLVLNTDPADPLPEIQYYTVSEANANSYAMATANASMTVGLRPLWDAGANAWFSRVQLVHSKSADFTIYPQATYEWAGWLWPSYPIDTFGASPHPVAASVSPLGNTLAVAVASANGPGAAGIGTYDLAPLQNPLRRVWPWISAVLPLNYSLVSNSPPACEYSELGWIGENTLVGVSQTNGAHPKLLVWRKVAGLWLQGFGADIDNSDQFTNRLSTNRAGFAAVTRYGVPSSGITGSYLTLYQITP